MKTSSSTQSLLRTLWMPLAALAATFLSSCASTTNRAPSSGMAMFDATPDADRRERIDGIHIASINGEATNKSELELPPGKHKVRVGFDWPQGGEQEVDLDFVARPGKTYVVYYDVHPPYVERLSQPGILDSTVGELVDMGGSAGQGAFVFLPPIALVGTAAMATRVGNEIAEDSRSAHYVDVMVVAQNSIQGVTCNRRVYPDGRVERR